MSATFIALLSAYYLCDAAATLQPLPPSTAQACAAHYEAVKATFRPASDSSPAARRAAYLRFKAWETENPDLVAHLRRQATENARKSLIGAAL